MMNRGLGEVFYGRQPVQYMRNGGVSSGRGSYAGYDPVAAATGRATDRTTSGSAAARTTTAATPAREPAQVTREPVAFDRDESPSDLSRAYGQLASSMREAGVTGLGHTIGAFDMPGEMRVRTFSGQDGFLAERFPELTRDTALRAAPASAPAAAPVSTSGLSRNMYGDVYGSAPPAAPVSSGRGTIQATAPVSAPVSTAGLSRPVYGDVYGFAPSGITSAPSGPAVSQGSTLPVETLMGGTTSAGQVVAPPMRPEQGGFFDGLGRFFGGMADDFMMGMTLMFQGEEGFIEKYGADALADYKRRTAETMARNEAEAAARGRDEDMFEACPEGFERDPVTQMCVPVAVKTEEEKPEEETKPEPTPSSAETLQDVINRITVGGGGTQPVVTGGGQNVLPNVDFFRPQFGVRRMQEGGAVDYRAAARAAAEQYGIKPDLFERLILRESNFDPMARSPKGAMGLAQVMPATARDPGFGVTPLANPMDPNENLRFGAEYLSALMREFGGDEAKALAAYNAGVGRVRKAGGVPDIQETRDYVDFILKGRGPVTAPPARPANLAQKGGVRQADVARAVEALTPSRRAPVEAPPMRPRPTMSSGERMAQLQGGMAGDSLSRAVDSVLSSLMR